MPDSGVLYGYRIDGPHDWKLGHRFDSSNILLDPYAKLVAGRKLFGDVRNKMSRFYGTYDFSSLPFDWGPNYKLPNIPEVRFKLEVTSYLILAFMLTSMSIMQADLVIYEMNVRAFTIDESSGLDRSIRGSYLGVISKVYKFYLLLKFLSL